MKQTVKTSRAAGQLEKMFRELNKHYFAGKLPEPIISLKKTPSAYGHITCSKVWQAGGENKYEINISSATLDRPIEETAATLLHEMVHEYCMETSIHQLSYLVRINSVIAPNPASMCCCCQRSRFPLLHFSQSVESILLRQNCFLLY